jgi:hypothetical protein
MAKFSKYLAAFLVLSISVMFVPSVVAASQVRTIGGSGYGPYQTGSGGEFTLQIISPDLWPVLYNGYVDGKTMNVDASLTNSFQTFCLEHSEYIYPNTTFDVSISNKAVQGGVGPTGDAISLGTAWLYSQFATGGLAAYGYDYANPGRSTPDGVVAASAGQLQNAIWMLEGEVGYVGGNPFITQMLTANNGWTLESAMNTDANGAYGVAVLNMYGLDGGLRQDQLVMASVPEPPAVLLLSFCLVGFAVATRWNKVRG